MKELIKAQWERFNGYRTKAAAWFVGVGGGLLTLNDVMSGAGIGWESFVPEGAKWRSAALVTVALTFYWLRTQTAKPKAECDAAV